MAVNFSKNISMNAPPHGKPSRNSLFEVGLLVIICVLFVWFVLLPKNAEVNKKSGDLDNIQQQQKDLDSKLTTLQTLIGSLPSNSQNIAILDQAIPLDGNAIRLQLLIQYLADSVGVTVGNLTVSAGPNGMVAGNAALSANPYGVKRSLQTMTGSLYVIGSFNQLQALLKKLESSGRLIDVDTLAIDQGSAGNLNMAVTFKAYYLGP
jgi:Tfp pilus assembly protein PilO